MLFYILRVYTVHNFVFCVSGLLLLNFTEVKTNPLPPSSGYIRSG